jgi:streptomycin 6-kinase
MHDLLDIARQWDVRIDNIRETPTSVLAFGTQHDTRVVLKVSKPTSDEFRAGQVLRAFNDDGTVHVIQTKSEAILMELLDPGDELVNLVRAGKDVESTEIFADLLRKMAHHSPPTDCPSTFDWARGFDRYLMSNDKRIPEPLVAEARELYLSLANSQTSTMLLHGDLQHYNVLFDSKRGWVAIDPKGIVGELEYEIGAIVRNPTEMPEFYTLKETVERRLNYFAKALNLNYDRALAWTFAQAVLSAIWDVEDEHQVQPDHAALRLANTVKQLMI